MPSRRESCDLWPPELFALLIPLSRRAVDRSRMAGCEAEVRIRSAGMREDLPRLARLEGFDAVDFMPARHCRSVGRIFEKRIMVELCVDCQRLRT